MSTSNPFAAPGTAADGARTAPPGAGAQPAGAPAGATAGGRPGGAQAGAPGRRTGPSAPPASGGPSGPTDPTNPLGLPDDLIVTGEAVALDVRPAMLLSRVGSGIIDIATYGIVGLVFALLGLQVTTNEAQLSVVVVVAMALVMLILPTTVETLTRGVSVGKFATGIRIVRDDGGPVRFRQAFVRALVGTVEVWVTFGSAAVITSLVNRRGKRLGDLLAGTYAARVRGSEMPLQPLLMPPDLERWAEQADIRRLPDQLAVQARVFLSRTGTLQPQARVHAAYALAAAVEPYVAPPAPWGTNPERFLAAVLVARRDREYATAVHRQERELFEAERMRELPYGITDYA